MATKLEGKIALVTGGSRGIGAAIAKRLAADGANVAITYAKGADAAASVVKEIERSGRKAIAIQADASDAKAVKAAVDKTAATFGRLDALVNNAGTAIPKTFEETTLEEMDRVIDITLLSMKHELRVMLAQRSGSIINVSSTYGHTGAAGASVYAASKHAVEGLTKSAALEAAAAGVRVNMVAPGPIETGTLNRFTGTAERKASLAATVPLDRVGRPEEIASTITFLASDKASFITGAS